MAVRTKRVYDPPSPADGRRYLVDRLWPRGLRKDRLRLTDWLQELAPSSRLRTWFGHDPSRYRVFRERYRSELESHPGLLDQLVEEARTGIVTLLFSARDAEHCNAAVLREVIEARLREPEPKR